MDFALRQHIEAYEHIIWDWNGTLLEDLDVVHATLSEQFERDGLPAISMEYYRETFRFPIANFYESLGYEELSPEDFHTKAQWFNKRYCERLQETRLYRGTEELLREIKGLGKMQSVLSLAEQSSLQTALKHFRVDVYFDHICGIADIYGRSKVERGRELLQLCPEVPKAATLLIGDTDHDLEVAEALGIEALLVADGHQSFTRLGALHHRVLKTRFGEATKA